MDLVLVELVLNIAQILLPEVDLFRILMYFHAVNAHISR